MVTLSEFVEEEVDEHIKHVILETINEGKVNDKAEDELVFNRYILQIDFRSEMVTIFDDVFCDSESLSVKLEDFLELLESRN